MSDFVTLSQRVARTWLAPLKSKNFILRPCLMVMLHPLTGLHSTSAFPATLRVLCGRLVQPWHKYATQLLPLCAQHAHRKLIPTWLPQLFTTVNHTYTNRTYTTGFAIFNNNSALQIIGENIYYIALSQYMSKHQSTKIDLVYFVLISFLYTYYARDAVNRLASSRPPINPANIPARANGAECSSTISSPF